MKVRGRVKGPPNQVCSINYIYRYKCRYKYVHILGCEYLEIHILLHIWTCVYINIDANPISNIGTNYSISFSNNLSWYQILEK